MKRIHSLPHENNPARSGRFGAANEGADVAGVLEVLENEEEPGRIDLIESSRRQSTRSDDPLGRLSVRRSFEGRVRDDDDPGALQHRGETLVRECRFGHEDGFEGPARVECGHHGVGPLGDKRPLATTFGGVARQAPETSHGLVRRPQNRHDYFSSASRAWTTRAWNAPGSLTASSASMRRSTSIPAALRPAMKRL